MPEDQNNSDDQGFRVIDRRREGRGEAEEAAPKGPAESKSPPPEPEASHEAPKPPKSAEAPKEPPQAEATEAAPNVFEGEEGFAHFLLSLATSAYMHLGLVPGPDGKTVEKNVPLAKQSIDILGLLEQKTQGNRSAQEDALLEQVLNELRMRYVDEKKKS